MGQCYSPPSPSAVPNNPWVGIALGLGASIGINIGNNVQALGMQMQQNAEDELREQELLNGADGKAGEHMARDSKLLQTLKEKGGRIWVAGTIVFVCSAITNFGAFMFAPASVLAPLESVQFITNLGFSRIVKKNPLTKQSVFATVLIVTGTTLAVVFGPNDVFSFDQIQLINFWLSPAWIVYVILAVIIGVTLQVTHMHYQKQEDLGRPLPKSELVLPVTFAGSSVVIGTQTVVQSKCLSELLELLMSGTNIFICWYVYMVVALFLVACVIWLGRLNSALEKYDPLYIVPMLQAGYICLAAIAGGIYFRELEGLSPIQWCFFVGGICVMLCGLYLLIPDIHPHHDEEIAELADEMERQESFNSNKKSITSVTKPKGILRQGTAESKGLKGCGVAAMGAAIDNVNKKKLGTQEVKVGSITE